MPVVEDARPLVFAGLQALRRAQVYVREDGVENKRLAKDRPAEVRPGKVGVGELHPVSVDTTLSLKGPPR